MLIPPKSFQLAWPIPFSICAVGNTESGFKVQAESAESGFKHSTNSRVSRNQRCHGRHLVLANTRSRVDCSPRVERPVCANLVLKLNTNAQNGKISLNKEKEMAITENFLIPKMFFSKSVYQESKNLVLKTGAKIWFVENLVKCNPDFDDFWCDPRA